MESISDRLKSLGFKIAADLPERKKVEKAPFEQAISGNLITNSLGNFYLREKIYPYGYQHGVITFAETSALGTIKAAARLDESVSGLYDMVFLDTETTGLSGGSGTFAFLVGVGRFNTEGFLLKQYIISEPQEESAMLLDLENYINPDDIFVTFNGKSFDFPLLKTRFILNHLPVTFNENGHLDMLHISRKLWRKKLESCALQELEREILKVTRSADEVPGWMIPEIYFNYLRTGDTAMLNNVIYHNAVDIVSLAAVFFHVSDIFEKNVDIEELLPVELIALAKVFTDIRSNDLALLLCKKCLDLPLSTDQSISVNHNLGMYSKIKKEYKEATLYWKKAAEIGSIESCIELSMYYEHQEKNIEESLRWVLKAVGFLDAARVSNHARIRLETERRINRLHNKEHKNV